MNLIETERLVRKLTDVLQNQASEAQVRPLAQAYADLCRAVNHRLEQCSAMLAQGDEHQALQLAEAPPPVLELASRLAFRESAVWREFCRKNDLTVPDPLEGRLIRQLNAAYGQGLTADHDLYRNYRQAVLLHRDDQAVTALRSIAWRNPADANAPRELDRLERKILRGRMEELEGALARGDDPRAGELVEEIETLDYHARPEGEVWRQGQEARCRVLLAQAAQCRAENRWADAAERVAEIRALCQEHGLQFAPGTDQSLREIETWTNTCHRDQAERERFERALVELRQMLARGEEQQQAGELPQQADLGEQLDALRHKWREVELADRSVDEDLAARVHKLGRLYETRLQRLQHRRRTMIVCGVAVFACVAMAASVHFWRLRQAHDLAAGLKSLCQERRVIAAETRLAEIRTNSPRLASTSPVQAAMQAAEAFARQERQRLAACEASLDQLQQFAAHGFTNLAPEQLQARFDAVQRDAEAVAKELAQGLPPKLSALQNRWDLWLDSRRNEQTTACQQLLNRAGEIAQRELRHSRGPENVRAGLTALSPLLRELQSLNSPSLARLAPPASLQAQCRLLQEQAQTFAAALTNWDQIQAAWTQGSSLEAYLDSLKAFQRSEFATPSDARAAGEVLALNVSIPALLGTLLLPGQPEAWTAFQADGALRLRPDEVVPAERTKFRELRDDENLHNVHVYRRVLRNAATNDPARAQTLYLRGEWENTRSALKRGMIYDPKDSPDSLQFRRQEFISNVQFDDLGRTPEAVMFETAGLKQLFGNDGTNYGGALLVILDAINRDAAASPIFRAWLSLHLVELLELRPAQWGAPWSPALAADRKRLRELGAEGIHTGDWLVPARRLVLEPTWRDHFEHARKVSYATQARFLHTLTAEALATGFALAGHVTGDGQLALCVEPQAGMELWGWAANPRSPGLLFRRSGTTGAFETLQSPLPFSPLFVLRADRRQLLAKVRQPLGARVSEAGDYLPPLFAHGHE